MKGESTPNVSVLLVDDDPGVRESVGLALSEHGAQVTPVASLAEARVNLSKQSFCLVLTDLQLAVGTEGLTVARLARSQKPKARIVLFSGRDLDDVADEAVEAGVDEMLSKPLSQEVLARLLTDLGTERAVSDSERSNRSDNRLSDEEGQALLQAHVAGDSGALDRIVSSYRPMMFSVFLRWFRLSSEDAEDLFQEAMLQLVLKAQTIRNVRTWLLGTAINQAKKRIRRLIRERNLSERYAESLELQVPTDTDDIREIVTRGLDRLRPSDRLLLSLIYIRGLSYQEVADHLGRPIGSIGPLRGRALKRLANEIEILETPPQVQAQVA